MRKFRQNVYLSTIDMDVKMSLSGLFVYSPPAFVRESKTVFDSGFQSEDFGFQLLDSGFVVRSTWIPDYNY